MVCEIAYFSKIDNDIFNAGGVRASSRTPFRVALYLRRREAIRQADIYMSNYERRCFGVELLTYSQNRETLVQRALLARLRLISVLDNAEVGSEIEGYGCGSEELGVDVGADSKWEHGEGSEGGHAELECMCELELLPEKVRWRSTLIYLWQARSLLRDQRH